MKNTDTTDIEDSRITLIDIFYAFLRRWYWFLTCVVLFGSLALLIYAKAMYVYEAEATVLINTNSSDRASSQFESLRSSLNSLQVTNEMAVFRSKELMTTVVCKLQANVSYQTDAACGMADNCSMIDRFRKRELYTGTPVKVEFLDNPYKGDCMFSILLKDASSAEIRDTDGNVDEVSFGDTLSFGGSRIRLMSTPLYTVGYYGAVIYVSKTDAGACAKDILSRMEISHNQQSSDVLDFSLKDYSSKRASDILNQLFISYNELSNDYKRSVVSETASYIDERLDDVGSELNSVESNLHKFHIQNSAMSVEDVSSKYVEQEREYAKTLRDLESQIRMATYIRDNINSDSNNGNLIISAQGIDDIGADRLIEQYNEAKMKRDRLVGESSIHSPAVKEIENDMASLKSAIIITVDNYIYGLQLKIDDIGRLKSSHQASFSSVPASSGRMMDIERDREIKEQVYIYLLNKKEEAALANLMVERNARVIDKSESTLEPVSPKLYATFIFGILAGLFLPALIILSHLLFDSKIRSRKDIEEMSDIPVLAEIPFVNGKGSGTASLAQNRLAYWSNIALTVFYNLNAEWINRLLKKWNSDFSISRRVIRPMPSPNVPPRIAYNRKSSGSFTEAMRTLCTNVDFLSEKKLDSRVLSMISYGESSGKTFITLNLAAAFADNNKKVIVVDMDLRRHTLSKICGLKNRQGVSDYLSNRDIPMRNIIYRNVFPGVSFIPAGSIPPNPVRLLRRSRLDDLIDALKDVYDIILIDSVPVDVVSDSIIVNRFVDNTLFIIRSGMLDRRFIRELESSSDLFTNVGVVINGFKPRSQYDRRYGYYYGYSYDYTPAR